MISRRIGERIVIGNDIEITVTEIHRSNVRLAIKTGNQQVLRGEIRDSIEEANRLAAATVLDNESIEALSHHEPSHHEPVAPETGPEEEPTNREGVR